MTATEDEVDAIDELAPPKLMPPYAVVILNDNDHTFEYVIEVLSKVFGYSKQKGYLFAEKIHHEGRAIVWTGSKEVGELKVEQIKSCGPDYYARKPVDWPLGVELEPMA